VKQNGDFSEAEEPGDVRESGCALLRTGKNLFAGRIFLDYDGGEEHVLVSGVTDVRTRDVSVPGKGREKGNLTRQFSLYAESFLVSHIERMQVSYEHRFVQDGGWGPFPEYVIPIDSLRQPCNMEEVILHPESEGDIGNVNRNQ